MRQTFSLNSPEYLSAKGSGGAAAGAPRSERPSHAASQERRISGLWDSDQHDGGAVTIYTVITDLESIRAEDELLSSAKPR